MRFSARAFRIAALVLVGGMILVAQPDWKTVEKLPAVDLTRLSALKIKALLRLLRNHDCTCGCGMKVAECRVKDPGCTYSKGIAATMGDSLRAGKNENDALAAAAASKWGHGPQPGKVLDDAVKIPTDGAPAKGPADAPITLVEFSDFQCPYCSLAVGKLDAVMAAFPGKVRLIFKQFPLDTHSQAALAAAAAVAAHQQGKFWPMHDALFAHRRDLSRPAILEIAKSVGLDMPRFQTALDSPAVKKIVTTDSADGDRAGVEGTPTVYLNGQRYNGSLELPAIRAVIEEELKKGK